MTRILLAAGVAALAISAPAAAGPHGGGGHGGGNGGGHAAAEPHNGGGGGHAQQQARGGGHAQQQGGGGGHAQQQARVAQFHGNDHAQQHQQTRMAERQQHQQADHARQARAQQDARVRQAERNRADNVRQARAEQAHRMPDLRANQARQVREAEANRIRDIRENQVRNIRQAEADRINQIRARENGRVNFADNVGYGVGGCPPGLAKKAIACMPPGQARKLLGAPISEVRRVADFERMPVRLQSIYQDTPNYYYQYGDGYAYRVNRADNIVSALLPLFGAGYSVGQAFPSAYPYSGLPAAYQPFYPASSPYDYRYANGYVYQVDPYTGMIANVDPMLGYGYGYGQMMPASYSAYNVPYQYRPYYYDTSDAYYRYAPGAIYQVDPQTSLITGIAALLTGGMNVGQPMPVGYSAYNVPYDYRAQYYDTPDNWYRYANGNIYRVDPATQLVTALVASALT